MLDPSGAVPYDSLTMILADADLRSIQEARDLVRRSRKAWEAYRRFDQAKVDRIAQAIRDGNYQINADAIADKLISNAQELLGKAGG